MSKKITSRIMLWGIVQGVGFRPYVAKLAQTWGIVGQVRNLGGLVEVVVTDTEKRIKEFADAIKANKPSASEIVHIKIEQIEDTPFKDFTISASEEVVCEAMMVPADQGVCPDCLREMRDPDNKRYNHPFISCMICGPRYSIIDKLPYDRENTSMIDFPMCDFCNGEYTDLENRRYHAQTISCHNCGPQMDFNLLEQSLLTEKPPLEKAAALLREGRVIAFKSMGGYNLMANPFDQSAMETLRRIKGRETKPFAVMFPSVEAIEGCCKIDQVEKKLIQSSARPIILLERLSIEELEAKKPRDYTEFAKSRFVGAFLPGMGAQYLLLDLFGGPLVATSANLSGMPMITREEEMFEMMRKNPEIAEVFYNSRQIRVGVDDSVARVIDDQPQMIRRAKGYAPVPIDAKGNKGHIFATGGQLKNCLALSSGSLVYLSQYIGDLDTVENQQIYHETLDHMTHLFAIKPEKIVCDLHPGYYTTAFAEKYSKEQNIPLIKVQHHHSHVASVMAEHDLEGKVLGVSFDGTGYGTDGAIWGGEFLLCQEGEFERVNHLRYLKLIGGDSSVKDAWKSALSFMYNRAHIKDVYEPGIVVDIEDFIDYAKENETLEHREVELTEKVLENGINVINSSSMGRMFDAISAMLGICDYNSYEGQCAILLEDAAARALVNPGDSEADDLALEFHIRVANMIMDQVEAIDKEHNVKQVALTGGVFQNKILMEKTIGLLRQKGYRPYYNVSVSPNDGGIPLGQCYIAGRK